MMKKALLTHFPMEEYRRLKTFSATKDIPMAQIIRRSSRMYMDAIEKTDREQLRLFHQTALAEEEAKAKAAKEAKAQK